MEVLRTDGDLNAGFTQNVQSRLCDEAGAEHKHLAVRGRPWVSRLPRLIPKPPHITAQHHTSTTTHDDHDDKQAGGASDPATKQASKDE